MENEAFVFIQHENYFLYNFLYGYYQDKSSHIKIPWKNIFFWEVLFL